MANGFVTDYSFLNLPEMGSAVRGPIELPSFEPVNYLANIPFVGRGTPRKSETFDFSPLPSDFANISESPGIRDIQGAEQVGAILGTKMAEAEKFYGDQVNQLQGSIQELETAKQGLLVERNDAIQMQDVIRQQLSEEKIQALNEQQARLQSELQQAVAEADARGVNAVAAAEARAAEKLQQVTSGYEGQINEINQALANVTAERDQAIAEQDVIKAQAAEEQAQALESQKQSLLSERQGLLGERESTIADLQSQISALQQKAAEAPAVISEQPATPLDSYLRDQERIDAAVGMMPGGDAIQTGIEELTGRVTAGGAKPEDFVIYQPPAQITPAPTPAAAPVIKPTPAPAAAPIAAPIGIRSLPIQAIAPRPIEPAPRPIISQPVAPIQSRPVSPLVSQPPKVSIPTPRDLLPRPAPIQPRPVSPIVSQPPRMSIPVAPRPSMPIAPTLPRPSMPAIPMLPTAPRMPIPTRPTLPIRPMGRFAGGGLVDMIQMRLNRMR